MLKNVVVNKLFHRYWWLILGVAIAAALCVASGFGVEAQPVGTVIKLSGPLSAKKISGSVKILGVGAEIDPGDTLMTGKNSYALIRFIDDTEITLRPGTTFKVDGPGVKNLGRRSQ